MTELRVLGLLSGSSLDGLDMGLCRFALRTDEPARPVADWSLERVHTVSFDSVWEARLRHAHTLSGRELWQLHVDFGHWMGARARAFIQDQPVDLISSHGHTVFHDPERRFTTQIGDGAAIAARSELPVVDQLRSADVARGGQGAPLAPLADVYLFPGYEAYLNLGGIANLTIQKAGQLTASDVGGANQVLNALAAEAGLAYDEDGRLARAGHPVRELWQQVDALPYFRQPAPKSLDNDWVRTQQWPIYERSTHSVADRLHTACRQLAGQIGYQLREAFPADQPVRVLVTGGGAFNGFLMDCIREAAPATVEFHIPDPTVVAFKEAALMALAGALRWVGLPNCFASVTGADRDTVNGAVYLP